MTVTASLPLTLTRTEPQRSPKLLGGGAGPPGPSGSSGSSRQALPCPVSPDSDPPPLWGPLPLRGLCTHSGLWLHEASQLPWAWPRLGGHGSGAPTRGPVTECHPAGRGSTGRSQPGPGPGTPEPAPPPPPRAPGLRWGRPGARAWAGLSPGPQTGGRRLGGRSAAPEPDLGREGPCQNKRTLPRWARFPKSTLGGPEATSPGALTRRSRPTGYRSGWWCPAERGGVRAACLPPQAHPSLPPGDGVGRAPALVCPQGSQGLCLHSPSRKAVFEGARRPRAGKRPAQTPLRPHRGPGQLLSPP